MRAWRERRLSDDEGISLVEVLVASFIFIIIITIITASIVSMLEQARKTTGQTNDLDAARTVITTLDHQVRYANAITTPGVGTDGSTYFEFRTGYTNLQQTCTQWRWVPVGGAMQYRTWQPPLGGVGSSAPTGWHTAGTGFTQAVVNGTTMPIFSIPNGGASASQPSAQSVAQAAVDNHYELSVTFNATSGSPPVTSESQVTITAINSTRTPTASTPPSVCTENGRP